MPRMKKLSPVQQLCYEHDDGTQKKAAVFLMRHNGDFLRTFFQTALTSSFRAEPAIIAREPGSLIGALNQTMGCRDDETASGLFECPAQYCMRKRLSINFLLNNAVSKDDLCIDRMGFPRCERWPMDLSRVCKPGFGSIRVAFLWEVC